jgi:hypothetical protein
MQMQAVSTATKVLKFAVLVIACQRVCSPCSCVDERCWDLTNDDVKFLGRVTRVNGAGLFSEYISVDFSVAEVFGKKFNTEVITVRTPSGSTACGYPFKEGVEYLVFARGLETNLVTSKCSRTQPAVTATAVLRQLRAIKAGRPVAQIYGFIGTEPYPGVSPLSRLSAKAVGSIPIMAVGPRGEFATSSRPDGSFEFTGLPASTYSIQAKLPADLFIWFARGILERKFKVRPGMTCEADIPLYPKNDPFGR